MAEPAARPSRPSVTFTAFTVEKMMRPAHSTQPTFPSSHPGRSARVSPMRVSISVKDTTNVAMRKDIPRVIQPFFFQSTPRLWARRTFRKSSRKPSAAMAAMPAMMNIAWSEKYAPLRRWATR